MSRVDTGVEQVRVTSSTYWWQATRGLCYGREAYRAYAVCTGRSSRRPSRRRSPRVYGLL